jgi:hypothetical protein
MRVLPPTFHNGNFVTSYRGENFKIKNSPFYLMHQKIKLHEELSINGGINEKCCFEMTILNRKLLMVLINNHYDAEDFENERLYEIIEDVRERAFILLTNSRMYVKKYFVGDKRINFLGKIYLGYTYSEEAEFDEEFDFQLDLMNHEFMTKLFENINV